MTTPAQCAKALTAVAVPVTATGAAAPVLLQVVGRARKVAAMDGVLRSLVGLCVGPEGPLPDLEVRTEEAALKQQKPGGGTGDTHTAGWALLSAPVF